MYQLVKRKIKRAPPIRGQCNKMWTWKSAHVQRKLPIKSGLYGPGNIYDRSWWNNFVIYDSLAELSFLPTNYCKIRHFQEIWELRTILERYFVFLACPCLRLQWKKQKSESDFQPQAARKKIMQFGPKIFGKCVRCVWVWDFGVKFSSLSPVFHCINNK